MGRSIAISLSVFLAMPAFADEPSAENMIARGHFARGAMAYEQEHYEEALREFEAAHAVEPLSALDYDIARCLDRLGRRTEAVVAYERYLGVTTGAENEKDVRARLATLRHELAEEARPVLHARTLPAPRTRRWIAPGTVGGVALIFAAVGSGLLGSTATSYNTLETGCAPSCAPRFWSSLPAREHAGEAILGLAAAAAVVDIALIVRAARRK